MLETPSIISVPEQRAAIIRLTVKRSEMQAVMPTAIKELRMVLAAQGLVPAGPMFAHHLSMDGAGFDFEVGFPINEPLAETGRVRSGSLPAARLARTIHRGGYEGLSDAWGELRRWIKANGHTRAVDLWEVYASGPETGSDAAEWRTELNQPLEV